MLLYPVAVYALEGAHRHGVGQACYGEFCHKFVAPRFPVAHVVAGDAVLDEAFVPHGRVVVERDVKERYFACVFLGI